MASTMVAIPPTMVFYSIKPFSAWLTDDNGDVKIVDCVLLNEENEAMSFRKRLPLPEVEFLYI